MYYFIVQHNNHRHLNISTFSVMICLYMIYGFTSHWNSVTFTWGTAQAYLITHVELFLKFNLPQRLTIISMMNCDQNICDPVYLWHDFLWHDILWPLYLEPDYSWPAYSDQFLFIMTLVFVNCDPIVFVTWLFVTWLIEFMNQLFVTHSLWPDYYDVSIGFNAEQKGASWSNGVSLLSQWKVCIEYIGWWAG